MFVSMRQPTVHIALCTCIIQTRHGNIRLARPPFPRSTLQRPADQLHNPHGDPHLQPDPPLRPGKVVPRHHGSVLLEPALLLREPTPQSLVARDHQRAGLEVVRVAAPRVVRAAHDVEGGPPPSTASLLVLRRRERDPQALGVVGPPARFADGAAPPLLQDGGGRSGAPVHGPDEAAGQEGVGVGKEARYAGGLVKAVGEGGGGDDGVAGARGGGEEQFRERGGGVEVASREGPGGVGVAGVGEGLEDVRDRGQFG
ncbi:hypothetical protein VTK73DRAFT_7731 [Phialemonium thermophilum]|uniref:Uncharacterized protein n=1 Tax=Phialemonium thermophilum TaxID=223376 RepID=A0ABR3WCV1_9PEZI